MMKTMTMKRELQRKASILKQHEVYAYQAAYYLLENEALAAKAVTQALMALIQDEPFFLQPKPLQQEKIKHTVMKQALLTKAAALRPTI
ncbi:hypothetical protein [Paenibacillus sp. Soil522]|uniref:hypothetical protein n=1 Tax=Paenibacillus sp. Soil522 TaxID=1736388 RepID=UPI000AA03994|nr:hypothetical protein [Paenibacillus sp. Soil522]